jgi:hypothetical protein
MTKDQALLALVDYYFHIPQNNLKSEVGRAINRLVSDHLNVDLMDNMLKKRNLLNYRCKDYERQLVR